MRGVSKKLYKPFWTASATKESKKNQESKRKFFTPAEEDWTHNLFELDIYQRFKQLSHEANRELGQLFKVI